MKAEAPPANVRTPVLCRPAFLWTLVGLGAALRIFQYASDTSFWFDELSLVRNLVHRSAAQLATEPLRYDQVAPVGFLVAEKGISRVLGESDLAFRFLLLPIGLAALVLFVPLARRVLDGYAVPFAVAALLCVLFIKEVPLRTTIQREDEVVPERIPEPLTEGGGR